MFQITAKKVLILGDEIVKSQFLDVIKRLESNLQKHNTKSVCDLVQKISLLLPLRTRGFTVLPSQKWVVLLASHL